MQGKSLFLLGCVAACASKMDPPTDDDPCVPKPVVPGGSAEVGLGTDFTPIADGQNATVTLGTQGFWMFIASARTLDMNVGSGDREGVVEFTAFDAQNQQVSVDFRCRVREFMPHAGAAEPDYRYLSEQYNVALEPAFSSRLEGTAVTLQVDVHDVDGRQAISRKTVIAHFPQQ